MSDCPTKHSTNKLAARCIQLKKTHHKPQSSQRSKTEKKNSVTRKLYLRPLYVIGSSYRSVAIPQKCAATANAAKSPAWYSKVLLFWAPSPANRQQAPSGVDDVRFKGAQQRCLNRFPVVKSTAHRPHYVHTHPIKRYNTPNMIMKKGGEKKNASTQTRKSPSVR